MSETYEKYAAIRQGAQNHSSEEYFKARPQIDSGDRRRVFEAGFERAYDLRETEITALRSQVAELTEMTKRAQECAIERGSKWIEASEKISELQRQLSAEQEAHAATIQREAKLSLQLDEAAKQEPVAWAIPGDDGGNDKGWINCRISNEGEFTKPLYAHPANIPSIIERARKEEREAALKIMRHAAAALAHAAESNPLYQDAYNEIDAAIRERKP